MTTITAGQSATFSIPAGQVAQVSGSGIAVLMAPISSPISIINSGVIGPFRSARVVLLQASSTIDYTVGALPSSTGSGSTGIAAVLTYDTASSTFSAAVAGATPTSYQYFRDGVAISGATAQTYVKTSADSGKSITATAYGISVGSNAISLPTDPSTAQNFDFVVYGGSMSAITSAIAAKKAGASVLWVSGGDDLGGASTSAIQFTDIHSATKWMATIPKATLSNELFAGLANYYSLNQKVYFRDNSYSVEAKVMLAQLQALCTKYGVSMTKNAPLLSLTKAVDANGNSYINKMTFLGIGDVIPKVVHDGTYTSDVLALANMDIFLGAEAAATYTETTGGYTTSGAQPTNPIDPYITPATPASGTIKYVTQAYIGTIGAAVPNEVQKHGFRLNLKKGPTGIFAFPAPANYVASDYELHRRFMLTNGTAFTAFTDVCNMQSGFPAIPSLTVTGKRDGNTKTIASLDFPDTALNAEYAQPTTTRARRQQIEDIAWQYTLGWLYFLQNDSSVPAALRADVATYGFPSDDYVATGGKPPRMYIREGIRVVGDTPLNTNAFVTLNTVADPIGLAHYAYDSHDRKCIISATGGDHVIQEGGTDGAQPTVGARIPMRTLYGKKVQCSNLLLTWGGNMSRRVYVSLRVEPLMGVLGEAAGYIAAIAAQKNIAVQDVAYADVNPLLNLYGGTVAGGAVVSTDQTTWTGGSVATSGFTVSTSNIAGTVSFLSCSATSGVNTVTITPTLPTSRNYDVQVKYIDSNGVALRGSLSWVTTASGVAKTAVVIDESFSANTNGDWQTIGTFAFVSGDPTNNKVVATYDNSGNPANVVAVRFVPA